MANWEPGGEVAGEEGFSFEDSDRFDEESMCSWMSEPESVCTNWRGWRKQNTSLVLGGSNQIKACQVTPLMELCAQAVAANIPFEQVEETFSPVPENVQLRIAYWSFPDNEEDIRLYSCLANGSPDEFQRGEHLVRAKCVRNVLQIGFHLCANVTPPSSSINKSTCSVAVTFDRCRITSCSCNCDSTAKWCAHVVALCLVRIQQPVSVTLRAPVSESLSRLRREQLQKFAQYLISELPQQILPTAQRLLDELLSSCSTEINKLKGAPDPTAGPSMSDRSLWYLDETALNDNIKKTLSKFCGPSPIVYSDVNSLYLSSTEPPAAAEYSSLLRPLRGREPEGIWNLLSIVREMLKRRDSNAVPLLDIVTEQCLAFEQVAVWWYNTRTSSAYLQSGSGGHSNHRPSNNISSEIAQHAAASMCDEIVGLWRLMILDPISNRSGRKNILKSRLQYFHEKTHEIIKRGKYKESHLLAFTGFRPAIEACAIDWDATEIVKCSHIVRKTKQIAKVLPNKHWKNSDEGTPSSSNNHEDLGACFYESSFGGLRQTVKKARPSAHRLTLSRKHADTGSASDDSCIERDIENLHLVDRWEVAESPLDFTSDDGSSACSPVQFTLSSSDDNEQQSGNGLLLANSSDLTGSINLGLRDGQKSSTANDSSGTEVQTTSTISSHEDAESSKYRSELDSLFTRAESLYTHGRFREACDLSVKLAEEFLSRPEELIKEPEALQGNRRQWIKVSTSYACKCLERALFLCTVLSEQPRHHTLAFRVGLHGLELKRLSASSKALEVKLFYQQGELAALMKRIPLGQREIARLREKAHSLASVEASQEFQHVLPLMLTAFIFDAFCQPPPPTGRNCVGRREIDPGNQDVGFAAAVNALGFKLNVSEAEHPLLCEGTRKQKGELAMQMLLLYKDQQHKLRMILQNFLDKSLAANLRASSAFPSYPASSIRRAATSCSSSSSHHAPSSSSSGAGGGGERSHHSNKPGSSGIATSQDAGNPAVDESTDDDDVRLEPPYNYADNSLPGPHGDMKSSCDDEYPSSGTVCSPPRRDAKLNWRSPTVRPKRKQHCIANVNSSASEEAMLSDTSPRLRRRNLSGGAGAAPSTVNLPLNPAGAAQSSASWSLQRYPSSPSSDSGSSSSADSMGTSSSENKRLSEAVRPPQLTRSPPRPPAPSNNNNGAGSKQGYAVYRKSRGRNSVTVPDIPNQPSEAAAHFFFEVAKNVLVKAGGNSSTSLFMQQPQGNNQSGVHRNLVLAAFEVGLYALGLHNCVSPNWLSRTYSSHVSWITGQAMEIGSAALHILVDSWEGHLTPPETASLADRASRGRDSTTVRRASELALSVLPHAGALNPNEISRALLQCKEQGAAMLEKACFAVEQAGRGGGVYPEVLFDVAKQWEWIHQKVNSNDHEAARVTVSTAAPAPVPVSSQQILPVTTVSSCGVGACLPTMSPAVSAQSLPVSVSGMVLPGGVITIQDPRLPPMQCHPGPILHGFAPTMLDPQLSGFTPGMPPMQYAAAVQLHPAPTLNLVPMPASNIHALQYHASRSPFLPDPHHHHPSTIHHQSAPPMPNLPALNIQAAPISTQLQSAFRVGMLALDLLTKRTEDRPNNKYARNPPYANDVKWILKLSMKLGMHYVQQFCMAAVGGVSSPFVLQDIAVETAKYLTENNNQQVCANLRAPFLHPIVNKCLQMYVHFIHNRLYHLHHASDHDEFVSLVHTARNAFCMTPGGILQFNEVLQSIHRSKACKKDLWQKINTGLSL